MECSGPSMIAYNKGIINIEADDLYRAQSKDGALMINQIMDGNRGYG